MTATKPGRVLIIGLDGATWDVLDPWMSDGTLPNLARLRQGGSWGALRSTLPPITAPAWSSFMTGKRPGKHGMLHFINLFGEDGAGGGEPKIVNARNLKSSTLWDIMGHHDRKVALINVPMTYPPRPVNGFMITGLLTPRNASNFTYPPELSEEITDYIIDLDRFIDDKPFQQSHRDSEAIAPSLALMGEFRAMLDKRARTSLALMDSKPWDVFMVVVTGTDRMGHYLWPYHGAAGADSPPEVQELHHAVRRYYVRLDEVVGELVERAGEDVTVILMSDHGMGSKYTKRMYCNNWLQQRGWLCAKSEGTGVANPDRWIRRLGLSRDKVGRLILRIPGLARSRLVKQAAKSRSAVADVKRSKAYCVPMYNNVMGIRINLTGEARESLRRDIMQGLKEIVDPETGQTPVREIYRGEDYYFGPYAGHFPDVIVILEPDYEGTPLLGHYSSVVTRMSAPPFGGSHRMEGIFMASGPDVIANPEPLAGLNIEDVAPTILYLMGLPVPSDMDGRPLAEIVSPTVLESRPIRQGEPIGFWPREDEVTFIEEAISEQDEAEIRERLQALGYLE